MKVRCPNCKMSHDIKDELIVKQSERVRCFHCGRSIQIPGIGSATGKSDPIGQLPEQRLAAQYIRGKNKEAVVRVLNTGILNYSRKKKFAEAEKLRELLIQTVPMALKEIIETGDIIKLDKSKAMNPEKIRLWSKLYSIFTPNEAAAFYFSFSEMSVMPNEKVFEQGTFGDRLYFVYTGRLIMSYFDQTLGQSVSYRSLRKGDIAGMDTFFNLTNHSETLTAKVESTIRYLDKKQYEKLLNENPAIDSKLCNYCAEHIKRCPDIVDKRRRMHKRFRVTLSGRVQQVDATGRPIGPNMNVVIVDISAGGLSFLIQNVKYSDANRLLGSSLKIGFIYPTRGAMEHVAELAKVVALRFHPFGECSIHVQFSVPLNNAKVLEIAQSVPS